MAHSSVPRLPRLETTPLLSAASLMTLEPRYAFDASVSSLVDLDDEPARDGRTGHAVHALWTGDASLEDHAEADGPTDAANTATVPDRDDRAGTRDIVFIDAGLPDLAILLSQVPADAEVVLVDRNESFADKAAATLQGRSDIGAIHIIAHGSEGRIEIGHDGIDPLAADAADNAGLAAIKDALSEDGDLLLYGCDFAADETGRRAAAELARLTDADVAVSDDASGGTAVGGDFDLEYRVGSVETAAINAGDWNHVLAAPIVISPLADQTRTDGQTIDIPTASSFQDPDGHSMTYSATGLPTGITINPTSGRIVGTLRADASDTGTYVVTVRATDTTGAFVDMTFNLTVTNVAPVTVGTTPNRSNPDGTNIGNLNFAGYFADGGTDFDTLTYSASGLPPGLSINPTTGVVSGTLPANASQTNGGAYSVVITATDASGAQVSQSFTWTVSNLPVVGTVPTQNWTDGQTVSFDLDTFIRDQSPDSDPVTVSLTDVNDLPPGLSFNPATNQITGTVANDASAGGAYVVEFTATDGNGSTITRSFTINVANVTPTSDPIPAQSGVEGNAFSLDLSSYFRDGGTDTDDLTYAATGLPLGLSIDPDTGEITGTLAPGSKSGGVNGVYSVNVTVTDEQGAMHARSFSLTVRNDPPTALATPPNQAFTDGQSTNLAMAGYFADPDLDTLTYSATGLPPGLSINPTTGQITGALAANASQQASYAVTVTATDPGGLSASVQFTIGASNLPVEATGSVPDQVGVDGQSVSIALAAYFQDQAPDNDALQYTITGLPPGLTYNASTGIISGQIGSSASIAGTYTVTVTVTDGQGSSVVDSFLFAVSNPAPTANPDTAVTDEDVAVVIDVLGNDTDPDNDALTVTQATASRGSVTILPDGRLSYTPLANDHGSIVITYQIRDANGATAQSTVTVTVNPVDDPLVLAPLPDADTADGEAVSIELAGAVVNVDGGPVTFAATGLPDGLSIDPDTGRITGTLSATASAGSPYLITVTIMDDHGGTAVETFELTVANPAPALVSPLPDWTARDGDAVTIDLGGYMRDGGVDADQLTFAVEGLPPGLSLDPQTGRITGTLPTSAPGTYGVTLTVTDAQGATYSTQFELTVINPAPQVTLARTTVTAGESVVLEPLAYATDPDGDPIRLISASANQGSVTITPEGRLVYVAPTGRSGTALITFTVADADGATVTGSFEVTIQAPPVAQPPAPPVEVSEDDRVSFVAKPANPDPSIGSRASGIVTVAVHSAADLGGLTGLGPTADPLILNRALNRLVSLSAEASDRAIDAPTTPWLAWSRDRGEWPLQEAGEAGSAIADARLVVETTLMADRIVVDFMLTRPDAVFDIVIQGLNGAALPGFVTGITDGRLMIERQPPGTLVTLEITALRADGVLIKRTITLDAGTGEIRKPTATAQPFAETLRRIVGAP